MDESPEKPCANSLPSLGTLKNRLRLPPKGKLTMENRGRNRKEILAELRLILGKDAKYEDGKNLSSMCTSPQPIAKIAHQMFLCSNLGDSGLFPGSRRLEQEVVRKLADLLNGKNSVGIIVSGGSEDN